MAAVEYSELPLILAVTNLVAMLLTGLVIGLLSGQPGVIIGMAFSGLLAAALTYAAAYIAIHYILHK